jgi:two-component system, OmpR family, sensor kinase
MSAARRWRPSLGFVLGGGLLGTLVLALAGMVALRYLGPAFGYRRAALGLGLGIVVLTALLGALMVRLLLRPIHALEHYAVAQNVGPAPPPRHFGTRELHHTARAVIAMAEALRNREATIRSFTDHVTHELKTPVSAIRAAVELLEDGTLTAPDRALLAQIDGARAQLEAQLQALRLAAQARESRYLGQVKAGTLLAPLRQQFAALALSVAGEDVEFPMAAEGMQMVLGHLLRNAWEHGASRVELIAQETGNGPSLRVLDNGRGISPGNAPHVFEPFFTTRRAEGGTGMGLAILHNLLAAHQASIALQSCDKGACFVLQSTPPRAV